MPNIASVLKEEIARLARKEVRGETDGLKKHTAQFRTELAAIKRRLADLERQVARMQKRGTKAPVPEEAAGAVRFSAKGLHAHRERLGLSAGDMGRLIGVSAQTVYNWESGSTRPRGGQLAAIATVRKMGKREVAARLAGGE